jgi:hypothetical protein
MQITMDRIETDDLSRSQVIALIEELLRNMHELSPAENVFAFDASKLKEPINEAMQRSRFAGC